MKRNRTILMALIVAAILCAGIACGGGGGGGGSSDKTPPQITSIDPEDGSYGIATGVVVKAQFSEEIDPSSVNTNCFILKDASGGVVKGNVTYANRVASFTPAAKLQFLTVYTAKIPAVAKDKAGNALQLEKTWSFTTVAENTVPAPSFDPMGGTYYSAQSVKLTCSDGAAAIRYTLDKSAPSRTHGTVYAGAIPVAANTTVKAIAYRDGLNDSSVVTAAYVIKAAAPGFSPAAGTHGADIGVTLTTATTDADIYYTMKSGTVSSPPADPANPTVTSTKFLSPIQVKGDKTVVKIKAMAVKAGLGNSDISSGTFTIDYTVTPGKWGSAIWGTHKWGP